MSILLNEVEFFVILVRLIERNVKTVSDDLCSKIGPEEVIRCQVISGLTELASTGLLIYDLRVSITSLANLVEISFDAPKEPKINLWPLVAFVYPTAKQIDIKEMDELIDIEGGTLSDVLNGGRFIDLK